MRRLSPQIETWLDAYHQTVKELLAGGFRATPANTRTAMANLTRRWVTRSPDIALVRDDWIRVPHGGIPVRIYHPAPDVPLPLLIYYHGGGHMAGSIDVYDPICRKAAAATRHIVVSVEYRLAPEHPYPAGVEDALAAAEHIWKTIERQSLPHRKQLAIAGDSGGGALCATVAHTAQRHEKIAIQHQVLIYPSLDYTMTMPSIDSNGTGYLLEKEKIRWYFDHYFQHAEDRREASPLFMDVSPGIPRTLVITAGFCPLRDEAVAYIERLEANGVHIEHLHFDAMIHAFLNLEDIARETCDTAYQAIGRFLAGGCIAFAQRR